MMYKNERITIAYLRCVLLLVVCIVSTIVAPISLAAIVERWESMRLLGREIEPGTNSRFRFVPDNSYESSYLNMPVFVARGISAGPTLCLTAGIHGDEINGVEVARRAFAQTDPGQLRGTLIALPSINAAGVRNGNRYLPDRRDLNRFFPGKAGGSVASLIANAVFTEILGHCDALVDLHTGSDQRTNLPQIRADVNDTAIRELAIHFGLGIIVAGPGPHGSLRREAAKAGVPAIIYEAGEPLRFQEHEIERGVQGVVNVMSYLDMNNNPEREIPETRIYERSRWIRANPGHAGFFFPTASLGDFVEVGESLGSIVDPLTDAISEVSSPISGEIIGMAVPRPVLSGYALFHLAWHE